MKKTILAFLIALLLLALTSTALALTAQPGSTIEIPIVLNNTNGCYVKISISYDTNVFDYISISSNRGQAAGKTIVMSDTSVLPSGQCGTGGDRLMRWDKADIPHKGE